MISKEHKKHNDIARPSYGQYSRNEWAIVGTQCATIQSLANDIIKALSNQYKCGYADAQHTSTGTEDQLTGNIGNKTTVEYTNRQHDHQFNYTTTFNRFAYRRMFNDIDFMLVNGNHFEAAAQVVVIDDTKKTSLEKRISQLTNVELILLANEQVEIFDFIKEMLPALDSVPVYDVRETAKIISFFSRKMQDVKAPVNGLVLAGGKSLRMGYDKGLISWHGKEQQYYMADLLKSVCDDVYVSCRSDQQNDIETSYKALPDSFTGLGPYGAILSAFRQNPDVSWLVVACDLPLMDITTLQFLHHHRNPSSIATTFESPFNGLPEPLITIWEPKSYPVLLSFLSQGYNCPGKVLQNSDCTVLKPPHDECLTNVNTQEELAKIKVVLENKSSVGNAR